MDPTATNFYILPDLSAQDLGTLQNLAPLLDVKSSLDPKLSNSADTMT